MTLRKKNTRLITIDQAKYRWTISPNSTFVVFVAEKEEAKGQKIEVIVQTDINRVWVECPHDNELNLKVVKPKDAELIIRQALRLGWKPDQKGSPLRFKLKDDKSIIKKREA